MLGNIIQIAIDIKTLVIIVESKISSLQINYNIPLLRLLKILSTWFIVQFVITRNWIGFLSSVRFIVFVIGRKGLMDCVDTPAANKCCILDPHVADKIIEQFDENCQPEVINARYFFWFGLDRDV